MSVLSRLFPTFFNKPSTEVVNGKERIHTIDLIVNNDTELSLFRRLLKRVSFTLHIYIYIYIYIYLFLMIIHLSISTVIFQLEINW